MTPKAEPRTLEYDRFEVNRSWSHLNRQGVAAIDGKTMRARQKDGPQKALHVVPAYRDAAGLVAGPRRVDSESNELTAIPRLLEILASGGEKCAAPVVWFWWRRPTPQRQGVFCFPRVPSAGTKDDEPESGRPIFEPD